MATSIIRDSRHMPSVAYNGSDWKEASSVNGVRYYFYENADVDDFDIPSQYCFVMVMNYNRNRGAALAIDWRSTQKAVWANRKHDDTWGSWYQLQTVT